MKTISANELLEKCVTSYDASYFAPFVMCGRDYIAYVVYPHGLNGVDADKNMSAELKLETKAMLAEGLD